ncbi:signal peptide peptidase SppA [Lutibacter sp. A64]|uniref:signal peptide peptidase SppA n=1 Tax=Lutibacter sp. A64 TaxID=2918526 RepID=UPI001F063506|nr:signal peptide peptidase SppA [Lutibacter sp. A64]UMB52510.1 signal peptide peptidase SppA [Lutibacter sp. A64]
MKFLRNLLASIFGTFIALGIIFMLFILIASLASETEKVTVKKNSVLELKLSGVIKDYAPKSDNPFEEIFGVNDGKMGLNKIINAIENAASDTNIKGISIDLAGINAGIAQTQAIRNALLDFKESGKFIKSYADMYDQQSYYLSSVADSVYVNSFGSVDFKGLSSEVLYYKDIQYKTGVKMEVIRHGKYKSAVEPFLYDEMSDNNRAQITSFLTSIWNEMLQDISESRNKTIEELNTIADNLLTRNADLALENDMVDGAIYFDEYTDKLKEAVGVSTEDELNKITLKDYISTGKGRLKSSASNKIAVIYAQGEIIYGKGDENYIGPELIINALRKAVDDKNTKAIVLRVNSPGGSALTSELIWRELELASKELPIVVSMGDVAASGGYYIACNADVIFAEPTTITGSIGVFGVLPNISELADNIGVNAEQVSTNNSANYSVFEPMSDAFRTVTQEGVEQVYTTFLERVAKGRGMLVTEVDSVAQGRVWSGVEAIEKGLVDKLGNLEAAITEAAELAGVTDYRVRNYPNYNIDFEDRLNSLPFAKSKEKLIIEELGEENYRMYKNLKQVSKLKGIQARAPFVLDIK